MIAPRIRRNLLLGSLVASATLAGCSVDNHDTAPGNKIVNGRPNAGGPGIDRSDSGGKPAEASHEPAKEAAAKPAEAPHGH